jgi:hypothetical protein
VLCMGPATKMLRGLKFERFKSAKIYKKNTDVTTIMVKGTYIYTVCTFKFEEVYFFLHTLQLWAYYRKLYNTTPIRAFIKYSTEAWRLHFRETNLVFCSAASLGGGGSGNDEGECRRFLLLANPVPPSSSQTHWSLLAQQEIWSQERYWFYFYIR